MYPLMTPFMHLFKRKLKDFVHIHIVFTMHYYIFLSWISVKELPTSVNCITGTIHYIQRDITCNIKMNGLYTEKIFVPRKYLSRNTYTLMHIIIY